VNPGEKPAILAKALYSNADSIRGEDAIIWDEKIKTDCVALEALLLRHLAP
jgi:hypothetical protein